MTIHTSRIRKKVKAFEQVKPSEEYKLFYQPGQESRSQLMHTICREKGQVYTMRSGPKKLWSEILEEVLALPIRPLCDKGLIDIGGYKTSPSNELHRLVAKVIQLHS